MNRAGVLSIVFAAAITGACGGADGVTSSPTGPSSTPTSSSSQPQSSCVPANLAASTAGSVVTLQWSAVSGATEYMVLVGSTPSSSDQLSTNTTNNSYTWTARPGQQYTACRRSAAASSVGRRARSRSPSPDRRRTNSVLTRPANPLDGQLTDFGVRPGVSPV